MNVLRKTIITALQTSTHKVYSQNVLLSSLAYKSAISLETLYPNSTLKLSTPSKPLVSMHEKFSGFIPVDKLDITYSRSSGPGGQNVNKVNTKVDVRFHVDSAEWLDADIRQKLNEKYKGKISKDGFLIFKSDLTRSQQMNLADCLEKIRAAIRGALFVEPVVTEETLEKIRRRKERASRERLLLKRDRSMTKQDRQSPNVFNV